MKPIVALVGRPNVGKSTIFNGLTFAEAEVASYPFTTIEPNVGVVPVPDERLDQIADLIHPKKVTPTTLEFLDIAGLVKGAHKGEGLGNQFLGHIRSVDAVAMVCRCFENSDVAHVDGMIDPLRDLEVLDLELILADLEVLERRLDKVRSAAKARPRDYAAEIETLEDLHARLQAGERVVAWSASSETHAALTREMSLLTTKQRIYVANVGEDDLPNGGPLSEGVARVAEEEGMPFVVICAQLEADLS